MVASKNNTALYGEELGLYRPEDEMQDYDVTFAGGMFRHGRERLSNVRIALKGRILKRAMESLIRNPGFNGLYEESREAGETQEEYAERLLKALIDCVAGVVRKKENVLNTLYAISKSNLSTYLCTTSGSICSFCTIFLRPPLQST